MKSEHLFGVHNSQHQAIVQPLFKDENASLRQTVAYINTAYESSIHPDDIRNKANRYWEEKTYQNSNKVNHFRKYTGSDTYVALNIVPLLRLAEMYLILVEDSPLSEAPTYFKTYRVARNLDFSIDISLVTEQDVINRLEKEYRKEFFGEGQMWFFYKKHNFTRFTWPKNNHKVKADYRLTPEKEVIWKKWFSLYNEKMLSTGEYVNGLYDIGYSWLEVYVFLLDGSLYFDFYASSFDGDILVKGLEEGKKYELYDYFNEVSLGEVEGPEARLHCKFERALLFQANEVKK